MLGQDTPTMLHGPLASAGQSAGPSMWATFQSGDPPTGLVELTTRPPSSTATQRLVVGHETLLRRMTPTSVAFHAAASPMGLLDARTLLPTATHRRVLGQHT